MLFYQFCPLLWQVLLFPCVQRINKYSSHNWLHDMWAKNNFRYSENILGANTCFQHNCSHSYIHAWMDPLSSSYQLLCYTTNFKRNICCVSIGGRKAQSYQSYHQGAQNMKACEQELLTLTWCGWAGKDQGGPPLTKWGGTRLMRPNSFTLIENQWWASERERPPIRDSGAPAQPFY